MKNPLAWLVGALYGSQAKAHYQDVIKAAVATYLISNPSASRDAVIAYITGKSDALAASALAHYPSYAIAVLTAVLDQVETKAITDAYNAALQAKLFATVPTNRSASGSS